MQIKPLVAGGSHGRDQWRQRQVQLLRHTKSQSPSASYQAASIDRRGQHDGQAFKAYLVVQDAEYHSYILLLQTEVEDDMRNYMCQQLMNKAFNFWKPRNDAKTWGIKTPEQQQTIALEAIKVKNLEAGKLKGGLKLFEKL